MIRQNRQEEKTLICDGCHLSAVPREGIWIALTEDRMAHYSQFITDYEMIRAAEGRGGQNADYYLALPYKDLSGKNQAQWTIRARTYSYLAKQILPKIQAEVGVNARVLDVGAGNGWMSYRFSQMGLRPVAVDLLVNDQDGLGAAKHYQEHLQEMFPRVQAESTRLPFASAQFDAVFFNASFHYAESYEASLREALRCLRISGTIVVADSPWYSNKSSGELMIAERQAAFLKRFGTSSDSIRSLEFLTDERLRDLEHKFGIRWERHNPFYGFPWTMRPWIASWNRRREPSRFQIYTARKPA
ncbi:class I SAM-dependent methyltransferase [Tunturiibacter empetritectus]|uniref:Ubiquinone/menaquinone biosynthesis C-methylase UbiE n=2 Tax=Tunturiibacter TaxID=3154218 RepID=A0A852VBX0_9BACT|nr:ubiquinone/menaquinone biosynthesis C-methylase UbiE [Edaphobacter lichenicola]